MKIGGRIEAAIAVLEDVKTRKRPVSQALKDWGLSNRFAGAKDRAAIGNIVYDALRQRDSTAYLMDSDSTRAIVLGILLRNWGYTTESLNDAFIDDRFAPAPLKEAECKSLTVRKLDEAPLAVQADVPEWVIESFESNFDEEWVNEVKALNLRPPLDLRVNTLKADKEKVTKALESYGATNTPIARLGLRIAPSVGEHRQPNVQADGAFQKGWFEVQDEGSQIVADLILAKEKEQILDFCAGGGGKTLAMASAMGNKGQIHAFDSDKHRLKPIFERLKRATCRNVQTYQGYESLEALVGKMDKVVVDAPCTGTGVWRRRPDAKWKLTSEMLEQRMIEQEEVLNQAQQFVKPNGYLIYITCSLLPQENEGQIKEFLEHHRNFESVSVGEAWQDLFGFEAPKPWSSDMQSVTLTPASTNTDGFFIAVLAKSKE